jgi:cellulose synthase operon protein C
MQQLKHVLFISFLGVLLIWASCAVANDLTLKTDEKDVSSSEFRSKLNQMSIKVDESIHTLREQIAESQSAPFLEDLYMQLAELLSQKSNTQYYIEMERLGGEKAEGTFSSVVVVQKESIAVYEKILKEFPATTKKAQIQYRIALALKSIDEIPGFMKVAKDIVHDYPGTEEATRTELLLGQYFFEKQDYAEASKRFQTVSSTPMTYERDLARYRLGLIELSNEKYQAALDHFEQVITDPELKEEDNPYSVSLKSKSLKTDLKREALVDSVRAFTQLHGQSPGQPGARDEKNSGGDAVAYYSRIAPSEIHFQEVIEKLAVRYIYLKNFEAAVKLLRSLCERSADPQRIVNIYREVLLMIPIGDRAEIPVAEMRFVLEQYHRWTSAFDIPERTRKDAEAFFEKQIRELATRNHSFAKDSKVTKDNSTLTAKYLDHAKDYYLLYLGNFGGSPESVHMASNLSDVLFAQKDWIRSGEYYLRTYAGEFGAPASGDREHLIGNAVLCLQKDAGNSFYETVRRRGLMIRALDYYIASSEQRKKDPALAFLRAKTRYEQGIFPASLEELYGVAKQFPASVQAAQAGEIILDYYNVRNDYDGLSQWSTKLLALNLPDATFHGKLVAIRTQSSSKLLSEKVRHVENYDEFAQGQSYLKTALASKDVVLGQMALQ